MAIGFHFDDMDGEYLRQREDEEWMKAMNMQPKNQTNTDRMVGVLKGLQEYRSIGTVEECRSAMETVKKLKKWMDQNGRTKEKNI